MYRLSARQILLIALLSGVFAAGTVACIGSLSSRFFPKTAAFTETAPAGITDPSVASDEQNNVEVYKAISPGVVLITSTSYQQGFFGQVEEGQGSGSGIVIDDQGDILTNNHVVEGAQRLTVSFGGEHTYPAKVIGQDPDTDLAVIKVQAPREEMSTIVPFGDSDHLVVGQKVLAIGNPFGFERTLTTGVISGLQRPIHARNGRLIEGAIQTDASINPGNSGGPLLDSHGRMIGINSQILSPSGASAGVGFAVPINIAKRIVPQLIQFGEVRRPKLGIVPYSVRGLTGQIHLPVSEGVLIYQTAPGGPAEQAGLRGTSSNDAGDLILGDIIVAIDSQKISNTDDLFRILDSHQVGDVVKVEVVREKTHMTVPVKLAPPDTTRRPRQ